MTRIWWAAYVIVDAAAQGADDLRCWIETKLYAAELLDAGIIEI